MGSILNEYQFKKLQKLLEEETQKVKNGFAKSFEKFEPKTINRKDLRDKFVELKATFIENTNREFGKMPSTFELLDKEVFLETSERVKIFVLQSDLKKQIEEFDLLLSILQSDIDKEQKQQE